MDDPADDIVGATYRALCEHGYADLTMRDIAAEADRSKAALHYHYDDKEGLLLAFLDHLHERFVERVGEVEPDAPPDERLRAFLSAVLHPPGDEEVRDFRTALLEIQAQAPYEPAFRERLARFDEFVADRVREIVREGVADGTYREDVDPDAVARFALVVVDGARTRHAVAGESVDCALESLNEYLDEHLRAGEAEP